ncbi:MAG: phosphopyruvate hydratase [Clostridiales bacterium]|nr:phosphopyruvate hydratase [Clostridiales bacterium]
MAHRIQRVCGREILDSRGNPTVEATVILESGIEASASVPSGASTGKYEAMELRDGDKKRFDGKGVLYAVDHINGDICALLAGMDADETQKIDMQLCALDGTESKSRLGANAILAVSLACARAAATALRMPLYRFIGGVSADTLPVPMMNVLNGGVHADNGIDVQEFMIMPVGAKCFAEGMRWCAEIFHSLCTVLRESGKSTGVGDEGGYAPELDSDAQALEYLMKAIERSGYRPGEDIALAIDAAASAWKKDEGYQQPKSGKSFTREEMIAHWEELAKKYPILSIEDGLDEDDWDGWKEFTGKLGGKLQLVGDDLFVTNEKRLAWGIEKKCANSILIKPNQIGTLTETMNAIRTAKFAGYTGIVSHRSGETEDTFIADLAVALNVGQIKTGAPSRSERCAKYNRLLKIEEELGFASRYPGRHALKCPTYR